MLGVIKDEIKVLESLRQEVGLHAVLDVIFPVKLIVDGPIRAVAVRELASRLNRGENSPRFLPITILPGDLMKNVETLDGFRTEEIPRVRGPDPGLPLGRVYFDFYFVGPQTRCGCVEEGGGRRVFQVSLCTFASCISLAAFTGLAAAHS